MPYSFDPSVPLEQADSVDQLLDPVHVLLTAVLTDSVLRMDHQR